MSATVKKISRRIERLFYLVLFTVLSPMVANAEPWDLFESAYEWVLSGPARAIAICIVMACGIGFYFQKLDKDVAVRILIATAVLFGAPNLADLVIGWVS